MVDQRFWVADGRRAEFEAAFGPGGKWTLLLSRAQGYLLTEVWCEAPEARQYRVKNVWSWHFDFQVFRERFSEDLVKFEREILEPMVEKKEFVGAYYEADGTNFEIT